MSLSLTVLEKNLQALKPFNSILYDLLAFHSLSSCVSVEPAKTGFYLKTSDLILNSKINPFKEGERSAEILISGNKNHSLFLIVGVELFYTIQALLNSKKDIVVFGIEHNLDILYAALSTVDVSLWIQKEKLRLIYISKLAGAEVYFQKLSSQKTALFIHRPSFNLTPEFYIALKLIINNMLVLGITNANTINRFEKLWFSHTLLNLPSYFQDYGIEALFNSYSHKETIIVGAGPSLTKQIALLQKLQKKTLIICVSTALPYLLENDIIPHLVLAVDPQDKIFYHFIPLFYKSNLSPMPILIAEPTMTPKIARHYPGIVLFADISILTSLFHQFLPAKTKIDSGGSVVTAAYSVALFLKASFIVLIGVDLSYTHKTMHFKGSELEKTWYFNTQNRFNPLEKEHFYYTYKNTFIVHKGFYGEDVGIDSAFKTYIDWLENRFSYYAGAFPTFNCTEGGIAFENIPNIEFSSISFTQTEIPFITHLESSLMEDSVKNMISYFDNLLKELQDVYPLIKKGFQYYNDIYKKVSKNQTLSAHEYKELEKWDEQILKISELEIISLNMQKTIREVVEEDSSFNSIEEKNPLLKNLRESLLLYEALLESTEFCTHLLDKFLRIMDSSSLFCSLKNGVPRPRIQGEK